MRKGTETNVNLLQQMGYESRDVIFTTIMRWMVGLFVFIGAMTAIAMGAYLLFTSPETEQERVAPQTRLRRVPPIPQLQADPRVDMSLYREAEDHVIDGYTAGGRNGERTNIPIDQAVTILAQRGISGVRGTGEKPPSPAYPGSGIYNAGGQSRADNGSTGDNMNYGGGANAYREGAEGAGGTGEDRTPVGNPDSTTTPNTATGNGAKP